MFEYFTEKSLMALLNGQDEARSCGRGFISSEEILIGLIGEGTSIACNTLKACNISENALRREVNNLVGKRKSFTPLDIPLTRGTKRALQRSLAIANHFGHSCISPEHLLLGILVEKNKVSIRVLVNLEVDLESLKRSVIVAMGFDVEQLKLLDRLTFNKQFSQAFLDQPIPLPHLKLNIEETVESLKAYRNEYEQEYKKKINYHGLAASAKLSLQITSYFCLSGKVIDLIDEVCIWVFYVLTHSD